MHLRHHHSSHAVEGGVITLICDWNFKFFKTRFCFLMIDLLNPMIEDLCLQLKENVTQHPSPVRMLHLRHHRSSHTVQQWCHNLELCLMVGI